MRRCFIFAAGTYYGLREKPEAGDLVLAADAGYQICRRENIVPDLLLGDFDSMDQPADFSRIQRVPVEAGRATVCQVNTDPRVSL